MSYMFETPNIKTHLAQESALRTPTTLDTAITVDELFAGDEPTGDYNPPEPQIAVEDTRRIGHGRNVGKSISNGFDLGEESNEFYFQTGFFLNYAFGLCTTFTQIKTEDYADDFVQPETPAVIYAWSSDTDTRVVYVVGETSTGLIVIDAITLNGTTASAGSTIYANGKIYGCYVKTSATLTISIGNEAKDETYAGIASGETISEGTGSLYVHIIEEKSVIPSYARHNEWENETDGNSGRDDLLGMMVKDLEIVMEKKVRVKQNVSESCAKIIAGSDLAGPAKITLPEMGWDNLKEISLKYDSSEVQSNLLSHMVTMNWGIANEFEIDHAFGDDNPKQPHMGNRDYRFNFSYYPEKFTLWDLKRTDVKDYVKTEAGCLQVMFRFERVVSSLTHRFQIHTNQLRVNSHTKPMKAPAENIDLLCDCELLSLGDESYPTNGYAIVVDNIAGSSTIYNG